jgi:hypothetical protein
MSPANINGTMLAGDIRHSLAQMEAFVLGVPYIARQHCDFAKSTISF